MQEWMPSPKVRILFPGPVGRNRLKVSGSSNTRSSWLAEPIKTITLELAGICAPPIVTSAVV